MSVVGNTVPMPQLWSAITRMDHDDIPYAMTSFRESYKESSAALLRMPWPQYKATVGKQLADLLFAPTTEKLAAYSHDGKVIGWIAYTPGRTISAVHWCGTRFKIGETECRRRGVMTALMDVAELGSRFVYTHRGPRKHTHRGGRHRVEGRNTVRGPSMDETIVDALRARGVTAAFVDYQEFVK